MKRDAWNRCDDCGKFIALDDFDNGAIREMILPDSDFSVETYRTLCIADATRFRLWLASNRAKNSTQENG